jgi:hypothetical protein
MIWGCELATTGHYLKFPPDILNSIENLRERTTPTELSPLDGEVSVNFCGWCRMVSAKDPLYSRFFTQEPLLFVPSRSSIILTDWVNPVPDPLFIRKSGSAGNQTRNLWICSQQLWRLDHRDVFGIRNGRKNLSHVGDCRILKNILANFFKKWTVKQAKIAVC